MRPLLAIVILSAMAATASTTAQQPVVDGLPDPTQIDFVRFATTQGGLLVALLAVLWSYRRDFLRKDAEKDAAINMLAVVVEKNTAASLAQAMATQSNTQATQALAQNVDRLEQSLKR